MAQSPFDSIKPGENIRVTIESEPKVQDRADTIARLMRRDPDHARALRKGHETRARNPRTKIRGGRVWHIRPKPAKVVRVRKGESWNMTYTHDLRDDFRSVESFLKVEKA
ncbi:MAG: hypothetical protein EA423_01925 [Phycisphaerales bacterium]|nr:hypothetical protein [Phycisphaerales bacterium]TVS08223.1 MAG: hypothetical protein EA423_01925 [Phycisphaerales bacterium]